MNAARTLTVTLLVGITAGLIWFFAPSLGVASLLVTQIPVLDHILSAMGLDDRLQKAAHCVIWIVLCASAPYCLARKKHGFFRVTSAVMATVAVAYAAWYAKDRWLVAIEPLNIMDPAIQSQAFDPYSGSPNLAAEEDSNSEVHVYWSFVKNDPLTGLPTHPLDADAFRALINKLQEEKQQRDARQRQEQEKDGLLSRQTQDIAELQTQNSTLQQTISETREVIEQQTRQIADLQAKLNEQQRLLIASRHPQPAQPVAGSTSLVELNQATMPDPSTSAAGLDAGAPVLPETIRQSSERTQEAQGPELANAPFATLGPPPATRVMVNFPPPMNYLPPAPGYPVRFVTVINRPPSMTVQRVWYRAPQVFVPAPNIPVGMGFYGRPRFVPVVNLYGPRPVPVGYGYRYAR